MLYDILPPIFLFSSLGGIIITLSRVMLRLRQQQSQIGVSATRAQDIDVDEDQIFKPDKKGVNMFKNRLSYIPHLLRQTASQSFSSLRNSKGALRRWRSRRQERKQAVAIKSEPAPPTATTDKAPSDDTATASESTSSEPNIVMPQSAWREKLDAVKQIKGLGVSVVSKAQEIRQRRQDAAANTAESINPEPTPRPAPDATSPATSTTPEPVTTTDTPTSPQADASAKSGPSTHKLVLRRVKNSLPGKKSKSNQETELAPDDVSTRRSTKSPSGSILDQASAAIASADYHQAEDMLLPYIIKHSRDAKAYMLLGQTALGQRDWSEAIEIFQQVVKINPSQPGVHAALGYAALKAGRFTVALQALQKAHDQDPEDLEVLKQLLRIAQRMDNSVLKRSVSEKITSLHSSGQYH